MRRVLPGGATLGGSRHGGDERPVACRPGAAVLVRTSPRRATASPPTGVTTTPALEPVSDRSPPKLAERLSSVKLMLEVLAVLVGLIGAVLALFGWSRK